MGISGISGKALLKLQFYLDKKVRYLKAQENFQGISKDIEEELRRIEGNIRKYKAIVSRLRAKRDE